MTMFEMKQREVFDLCYSFFSKMDFSWVVSSVTKEAEEQIKKTVVISENLNRFLGRESKKEGNSKSELVSYMVHLLLKVANKHKEEVVEKVKCSVAIMSKIVEGIYIADEQLREIWGEEEWDRINENSLSRFTESGIIVDNVISDLQDMVDKLGD